MAASSAGEATTGELDGRERDKKLMFMEESNKSKEKSGDGKDEQSPRQIRYVR